MAFHELATNAVKYGALSNQDGKVRIAWSVEGGSLVVEWQERGGPAVEAPTRKGFGSTLIEQAIGGDARLEFSPDGVKCTLMVPLKG